MSDTTMFILSFFIGALVGIGALNIVNLSNGVDGTHVKQQCEKTLPRNQHCIVIAVPDEAQL